MLTYLHVDLRPLFDYLPGRLFYYHIRTYLFNRRYAYVSMPGFLHFGFRFSHWFSIRSSTEDRPRAGTDWTVGVWGGFRVLALGQTPSVQSVLALGLLRVDSLHAYVLTCALACKLTCLHAYTLTCVHAYMHVRTCLHAYMF